MTNNYAILVSLGFSKEDYKFENFKSNNCFFCCTLSNKSAGYGLL